jgi:hypothetical protein
MAGGGGGSYTAPRYTSHANEVIRFRNKVTADRITSSQAKRRAVVHRQEVIRFRNKVTADRIAHSRINRSGMARRDAPKPRPRITGPAFTGLFPQGPPARGAFIPSPQGPSIGPAYPLGTFNSQGYGTPDTPYPSGSCSKLKFIEDKGTLVLSEPLVYRDRVPIQGHPDIGAVRSEHYATFGFSTVRARLYLDTHTGNYVIGLSGVEKVSRDGVQMSLAPRGARSALPFYDGPAGGWKPGWPEEM